MPAIDMNRPLITMISFERDGTYGPRIHMYLDEPGVYLDAHGKEVPAVVAKRAGFDIEQGMVAQSVMNEQKRLMERYQSIVGPKLPHVVEETRPLGHQLVRVGQDKYHIRDGDGKNVTSTELSRTYAVMWLDDIDPMPLDEGLERMKADEVEAVLGIEPKAEEPKAEAEVEEEAPPPKPGQRRREKEPELFPAKEPPTEAN